MSSGEYQDLIPGTVYPISLEVESGGTPFTGSTVNLDLDSPSGAIRISKSSTSFANSDTLCLFNLSQSDTDSMGVEPGEWSVVWRVGGVALSPIRTLEVTIMPAGDLA